jgi:hypothetical protein
MDCFVAEFIIGPAEGGTRWLLAMTVVVGRRLLPHQRVHMLHRLDKVFLELLHHGAR